MIRIVLDTQKSLKTLTFDIILWKSISYNYINNIIFLFHNLDFLVNTFRS